MWDTLINFWNIGIHSSLIFGDNCRIFLKDMGYFLKKLMGYGILGPPLPGPHLCSENNGAVQLCCFREADLRLCFRICKTLVFS